MPDFWKLPMDEAMKAYADARNPSLTEQLLYAILSQLDKISAQLDKAEKDGDS